jgi:hypothetical protein
MNMQQPQDPFCQSCGMPMVKQEDFGGNADSSRNEEYCRYCFQNGKFTEPNVTLEQMIDKLVSMASKMNMTEDQARNMANSILPQLKRWKK